MEEEKIPVKAMENLAVNSGITVEEEEVMEWPDKNVFRTALECPVCFSIPFGEIISCRNGHHVCKYCMEKISSGAEWKICPCCKDLFQVAGTKIKRNFALEEIIEKGTFSCPRGCKAVRKGSLMDQHIEDECENREINCDLCSVGVDNYCGVKVLEYVDHVMMHHGVSVQLVPRPVHSFEMTFEVYKNMELRPYLIPPPLVFKFDEEFFLIRCEIKREEFYLDCLMIWVQILGGKSEAQNYRSVITIKKIQKSKTLSKISWNIPVSSFREDAKNKRTEQGTVASLNIGQLEGFSDEFINSEEDIEITVAAEVVMSRKDGKQNPGPFKKYIIT